MLTLTFRVEFRSNYHLGAGYGKGFATDSVLLRDADGKPVLRGTAVAGLLRDGACRLLEIIPYSADGRSCVDTVFGTPEREKAWRFSSAKLVSAPARLPTVRWRARIDPRTRRVEPNKLFSQEDGLEGTVFQFDATRIHDSETGLNEAALLTAAARMVRGAGRSRRRGFGECVIHLVDVTGVDGQKPPEVSWEDWLLERFEEVWVFGRSNNRLEALRVEDLRCTRTPDVIAGRTEEESFLVRFRVVLRLDEPVLVAQRSAAGNRFETHTFIPGTVLWGALASLAARHLDRDTREKDSQFVDVFLRGGLKCSALYPAYYAHGFLSPTCPPPLGLWTCSLEPFRHKKKGHGVFQAWDPDVAQGCPCCGRRLEHVGQYLLFRKDLFTLTPRLSTEMHIRVDRASQRAAAGNLYSYRVLSSGQYFVGEMVIKDESSWCLVQAWTGIEEKKTFSLWLGKARRRGYGKVTAWLERMEGPAVWMPVPLQTRVRDPETPLSLLLVSDAIISDDWGRQGGLSEEWLERELGLGRLTILDVIGRTKWVDGFSAVLGLPRWRDTALAAGTTVRLKLADVPENWAQRMEQVEREGIGMRRHEGFGRVVFNPVFEGFADIIEPLCLPDVMQPEGFVDEERLHDELWEQSWESVVAEKLKMFGHLEGGALEPWIGLARWLYTHRYEEPEELAGRLRVVGQPDEDLIRLLGGADEAGERAKINRFQQNWEEQLKIIDEILRELQRRGQDHRQWAKGIDIVARRLAGDAVNAVHRGRDGQ